MHNRIVSIIALWITMVLIQVLVFDHIVLFGVAVPFVYIYFIVHQPVGMSLNRLLTLAFLAGLCVDVCVDTPGVNALACTLATATRRKTYFAYAPRDDDSDIVVPSIASMGFVTYLMYLLTFVLIFCMAVFAIEYFSVANVKDIVIKGASSALLTTILLLALDALISAKREK